MSRCAMFCVRGPSPSTGRIAGEGIDCQPQPQHLCGAAQPGAQFVQLEVGDLEVAEAALVQGLSVLASARQSVSDGGLTVAEDPFGSGSIEPFCEREIRTIAMW